MLKTALGQSRTASLVLGAVVPASLGKEAWMCQLSWRHILRRSREEMGQRLKMETAANAVQHSIPNLEGL